MAKISARGAKEVARWKKGEAVLVLASDGRLLGKYLAGDGYTIRGKNATLPKADAFARRLGYTRV